MTSSPFAAWNAGLSRTRSERRQARGLEIVGIVFLFFYFWPLAFAYLTWKMLGYPVPAELRGLAERAAESIREFRFGTGVVGTGNLAFDEYRRAEIVRLERERRRLDDEAQAFRTFVDDLKRAKDREEFDAFMARRRADRGTTAV
jgi:hypothetical protein